MKRILFGIIVCASLLLPVGMHTAYASGAVLSPMGGLYTSSSADIFARTDSMQMNLAGYANSGDLFDLDLEVVTPTGNVELNYAGALGQFVFDNGDTFYLSSAPTQRGWALERLAYDVQLSVLHVTLRNEDGLMLDGDYDLSNDRDAFQEASEVALRLDKKEALALYSLSDQDSGNAVDKLSRFQAANVNTGSEAGSFSDYQEVQPFTASYSGYYGLIRDLNDGKTVTLSSYSVNWNFFDTNGWHHDNNNGTGSCAVSVYTAANGGNEYLVQLCLLDINKVPTIIDGALNGMVEMTLGYAGGCVAEYNANTGKITVRFADAGLRVSNAKIALGGLSNNACFTNMNGSASSSSSPTLIQALGTVTSSGVSISDILSLLSTYQSGYDHVSYSFGTYDSQVAKGRMTRSIGLSLGSGYLNKSSVENPQNGHYMTLSGVIWYSSPSVRPTWQYVWSYTANHDL